jgi:RHH-type rel operon transcriptional repressor/antitoxin RelB
MEVTMLAVRLSKEIEEKLERLARETRRSKSYYVKEALSEYLAEKEDVLIALSRLEKAEKPVTAEALWRALGWEDAKGPRQPAPKRPRKKKAGTQGQK